MINEQAKLYEEFPWLIFLLNGQQFAVNCRYVTTIQKRPTEVVPAIDMPEHVSGLVSIRDEIIPLIDTKYLFGMKNNNEETAISNESTNANQIAMDEMVVVLQANGQGVGYHIDDVMSVEDLNIVSTAHSSRSIEKSKYLYGVGTLLQDDNLILLLDDIPLLGLMD